MKNTKEMTKNTDAEANHETIDFVRTRKRGGRREDLSRAEMPLLFLVPLVETAWAHGAIARGEKHLIFTAARGEAIDEKHPLNETLDDLLVYQPGRQFFDDCLSLIKAEFAAMTVKERELKGSKLVNRCRQIAAAAGGNSAMDVDKFTSPEEREVLTRIVSELSFREDFSGGERRANVGFSASKKANRAALS